MKKGFTLIEIMMVVIILGVLAGVALPRFLKTIELQKVEVAKQQIDQIKTAAKVIALNNKQYDFCGLNATSACLDTATVNQKTELDIHNADFNFVLGWDEGWYVHAVRQNGPKNYTMSYYFYDGVTASGTDDSETTCVPAAVCAWINM